VKISENNSDPWAISATYSRQVILLQKHARCYDDSDNACDIYIKIPPTTAMTEIVVKIIVELLSRLAVAAKQMKQGQPGESPGWYTA
jgi:hypothetical protein